jgi:N-acetylmuramoyl-L-alanine amidase
MSTFKPLKILASRRQVLKAGLAAMTLSGSPHRSAQKNSH